MDDTIAIHHAGTEWRFDRAFLGSNWTCIWGKGCKGILDRPSTELQHGCCSVGAQLTDEDEARLISALGACIPEELFERAQAARDGIFADLTRSSTRVVDGVCIFHNSTDFPGGAGCALHLAAQAAGESPLTWKPGVCWQLPVRLEESSDATAVQVRAWSREDWGDDGKTMAWCCTEEPETYVGQEMVLDSLANVITELVGTEVYIQLRSAFHETGSRNT